MGFRVWVASSFFWSSKKRWGLMQRGEAACVCFALLGCLGRGWGRCQPLREVPICMSSVIQFRSPTSGHDPLWMRLFFPPEEGRNYNRSWACLVSANRFVADMWIVRFLGMMWWGHPRIWKCFLSSPILHSASASILLGTKTVPN